MSFRKKFITCFIDFLKQHDLLVCSLQCSDPEDEKEWLIQEAKKVMNDPQITFKSEEDLFEGLYIDVNEEPGQIAFHQIKFPWNCDKEFFVFMVKHLEVDELPSLMTALIHWDTQDYITLKRIAYNASKFWKVIQLLEPRIDTNILNECFLGLKIIQDSQDNIDKKLFSLLYQHSDKLLLDKEVQLKVWNALGNILNEHNRIKYEWFLSQDIKDSLRQHHFSKPVQYTLIGIEIDKYKLYNSVQIYPLGTFTENMFVKVIDKCLQCICHCEVTTLKKFRLTGQDTSLKKYTHFEIYLHCDNAYPNQDHQFYIELLNSMLCFLKDNHSINNHWEKIDLLPLVNAYILNETLPVNNCVKVGIKTKI